MDKEHKISELSKFDIQVESIEACDIEEIKKSFASLADSEDLYLDPDLMYARFIMCHEGANSNGDTFTNDVLMRAQHTPRFKPIDWEHGQPMIGHIIDSRYVEDAQGRGYIEAVGVIWKFIYPDLADTIKQKSATGELKLSMECYFKDANYKYGEQIFDQEQADELGIADYVGREYSGQMVYRVFKDVIFGGVGVVANPADKEAVFLAVAKKQAQEAIDREDTPSELTDEQVKLIASIIRNTNDFRTKEINKETIDAVTVSKFVKAFDKAKSDIVNRFNKDNITTKEQLLTEVRNIVSSLLSDVSSINNDYFLGRANEDSTVEGGESEIAVAKLNLKLCDQCPDIEVAEEDKGGCETMLEDNTNLDVTNEEVEEVKADETVVTNNPEQVEEVEKVDYQAKASELESKVADLELKLQDKETAFANLQEELNTLKNKVEASEKEVLISSRMTELSELGIEFSEARKAKELDKISAMDNDSFADYKEFLSELLGKNIESAEATEVEEVETVEEVEVEVENVEQASASLNIETEKPKVIKPFGHLSE